MTPAPAHAADSPSLVSLLTRQRDLYRDLKSLSDQQATLIERGDTDHLLSVLATRQGLVDALTAINRELVPVRQSASKIPAAQQARVRDLMAEVDALLREIIAQDDRDRQTLQSAQQRVGSQIRQIRQGGAAMNAYRAAPQVATSARFTDRKG